MVSVEREDQRAAVPVVQGDHGGEEEEGDDADAGRVGVDADEVGVANAGIPGSCSTPKPPKTAGEKVTDDGDGGTKVAAFLVAQKLI